MKRASGETAASWPLTPTAMVAKVRRRSGSTSNTLCSAWLTTTSVPFSLGAPASPPVCNVKRSIEKTTASANEKLMSFLERMVKLYLELKGLLTEQSFSNSFHPQIHFTFKRFASYNIFQPNAEGCTHVLTAFAAGSTMAQF